jgi:hypothetical protein
MQDTVFSCVVANTNPIRTSERRLLVASEGALKKARPPQNRVATRNISVRCAEVGIGYTNDAQKDNDVESDSAV